MANVLTLYNLSLNLICGTNLFVILNGYTPNVLTLLKLLRLLTNLASSYYFYFSGTGVVDHVKNALMFYWNAISCEL